MIKPNSASPRLCGEFGCGQSSVKLENDRFWVGNQLKIQIPVLFGHFHGNQTRLENWSAEKMARNGQETVKFYDSGQALTKVGQIGGQVFKSRDRPTGLKSQRETHFIPAWGF
jgi:hypothetical protein